VITIDTSGFIALIDPQDRHHYEVVRVLRLERGLRYIPTAILAEITHLLEDRAGQQATLDLLKDLQAGAYARDHGEHDLPRIYQLVDRYRDIELGFADSAVIACDERHGGRILTTDQRHFRAVERGEKTIIVLP
jgi:predicted nucleic acid-binding protein